MPDIVDGPVIERGGGIGVLELLGDPALFSITVFFIQNAAVPLQRFIGADASDIGRSLWGCSVGELHRDAAAWDGPRVLAWYHPTDTNTFGSC